MPRALARVRRWGRSLVIVVPDELAKKLRLKPGDEVVLDVGPVETERTFGSMSDWRVDPQRLKDELREAW